MILSTARVGHTRPSRRCHRETVNGIFAVEQEEQITAVKAFPWRKRCFSTSSGLSLVRGEWNAALHSSLWDGDVRVVLPHAPFFFPGFRLSQLVLWLWWFHVISAFTVSNHQGFFLIPLLSHKKTLTQQRLRPWTLKVWGRTFVCSEMPFRGGIIPGRTTDNPVSKTFKNFWSEDWCFRQRLIVCVLIKRDPVNAMRLIMQQKGPDR